MARIPGLESMRSLTKFGLSQVTLDFKDGTDIYRRPTTGEPAMAARWCWPSP